MILIGEEPANQSTAQRSSDGHNAVLQLEGNGVPSFIMKGKINNERFDTMIDSGSAITKFNQPDLRKILKMDAMLAKPPAKSKQYVDYYQKPLKLAGSIKVNVKVGKRTIKRR